VQPKSHSNVVEGLKDTEIKSRPRITCLRSEIKVRILPIYLWCTNDSIGILCIIIYVYIYIYTIYIYIHAEDKTVNDASLTLIQVRLTTITFAEVTFQMYVTVNSSDTNPG